MILRVEIFHFQSHAHSVLEFSPNTNVIIGPSDAGKSAIFRAINWVLSNRPLGDSYRSEWGGETRVALHLLEGDVIERIRSDTRNEYVINGKSLKAFGTEVPEEVSQILRMDAANIQAQMDPAFLLASTPGEASRLLNKAASIDDIDRTVSGIQKAYRELDRRIKFSEEQYTQYDQQLEQFADIPDLEERLEVVEEMDRTYASDSQQLESLRRQIQSVQSIEERLERTQHVPALEQKYVVTAETARAHGTQQVQYLRRTAALQQVGRLQQQFDATEVVVKAGPLLNRVEETTYVHDLQRVQHQRQTALVQRVKTLQRQFDTTETVVRASPLLGQVEARRIQWAEMRSRIDRLHSLRNRIQRSMENACTVEEHLQVAEVEFHELAPEICPLCGGEM